MIKRKKTGRTSARKPAARPTGSIRRTIASFFVAGVAVFQVSSCGTSASPAAASPPARQDAAATTGQFTECRQHFPAAPPAVAAPGQQRALCFAEFAVLHSGESKTPVYVVERLTRAGLLASRGLKRSDRFYPEARLPGAHRAQLEDYAGSGFDRGHMAPAGDMATPEGKAQSFSLANIAPQAPALNQGAWNNIEQDTRRYVERAPGDVFVFTGPWFEPRPKTIGPGRVWVPAATWKLVYTPANGRAWAYWMSNDAGPHSLKPISYQSLLQKTGLRLLPSD